MSRVLARLSGSGTAGAYADGDKFKLTTGFQRLKEQIDLLLAGAVQRNVYAGGSKSIGLSATATGDLRLSPVLPIEIDNTVDQISDFTDANGATLVVRFRFAVRVSNAAITVTPKVWQGDTEGAITVAATISGTAACSATNSDYSGTDQLQTITLTLPTAAKFYECGVTIGGTPASGYEVWAQAMCDVFVELP
jgi:hypothetical protein